MFTLLYFRYSIAILILTFSLFCTAEKIDLELFKESIREQNKDIDPNNYIPPIVNWPRFARSISGRTLSRLDRFARSSWPIGPIAKWLISKSSLYIFGLNALPKIEFSDLGEVREPISTFEFETDNYTDEIKRYTYKYMQELSSYDSSGILAKQIKFAKGIEKPSDELNAFFDLANNETKDVFVELANQDVAIKKAKEHDDFWREFREAKNIDEKTSDEHVKNILLEEIFVNQSIPKLQSIAFSVKDEIPVADTETLDGLKRETIIEVDGKINKIEKSNQCIFVTKLETAGGIFVAKTVQAIFGINTTGENSNYPQLESPIVDGHVTGGSSSGAGYVAGSEKYKDKILVNVDSDAGGSNRIPANNNSSHALKSTRGTIDKANYNNVFPDLCEIGAITQCNYDTALIYMISSGQYPAFNIDDAMDLNITLEKEAFLASDKTIALKTLESIKQLQQQTSTGHNISFTKGCIFESKEQFEIAANGFYPIFSNNAYNGHKQFINAKGLPAVENLQLIGGGSINQDVLNTAKDNQKLLTDRANKILSGTTVSLSPTTLAKIPKRTVFEDNRQGELNFGKEYSQSAITSIHNQAGTPSLQIPIGTHQDKYPLGLCISSAAGSDYLVIYVANLLSKAKAKARID